MKQYDIIIIGAGPGGYVAAIHARHLGAKVALIEKQDIGGVCLNIGCIPTKALIKSAKVYQTLLHSENYGIEIKDKSQITFDYKKIVERKDRIVKKLNSGVKMLLEKNGVDIYPGFGVVIDKNTVDVNGEILTAKNLILATGSSPVLLPIPGLKESMEKEIVLTSKEMLSLESVPKKLAIIGGGIIGIEFASLFSAFGSEVTILEKTESALLPIDRDIRDAYLRILKKQNVRIYTNVNISKIDGYQISYSISNKTTTDTFDKILLCVGMKPNISGLESLHLEIERNAVKTNDRLQTNVKGVYAIGDLNGKMMLAHVASAEGIVAVENCLGKSRIMNYDHIPSGIYGFPEIAMVGLTEQECEKRNLNYKTGKFPLTANGKALADGDTEGFIKIIYEPKYTEILGVQILAVNATDLITEAAVAMDLEGTVTELAKTVHPHPTLSETIMEAAHAALGFPIHILH